MTYLQKHFGTQKQGNNRASTWKNQFLQQAWKEIF